MGNSMVESPEPRAREARPLEFSDLLVFCFFNEANLFGEELPLPLLSCDTAADFLYRSCERIFRFL